MRNGGQVYSFLLPGHPRESCSLLNYVSKEVNICSLVQPEIYQQLREVIPNDLQCLDMVCVWLTISFSEDSENASFVED
jgi:hypothetical protein